MKKIEDFSTEKVDLKHFYGNGEFVHTAGRYFSSYINDTYYDSNGNNQMDENEKGSFTLVIASAPN